MEEVILLRSLCWSKPARDFKFAAHHRGIAAINRQIKIFKHNEGVRSLHIIKKMNQRRPGTLCFNGSKNRLMIWRCFPGTNRGILDQNIILDRKSTRLNSSHGYISYAVFCLKKKTHR